MKIAICEDVQSCAETLENFIRNWSADNGVFVEIYTYSSAEQYLFYLDETADMDLLFLDIRMGDMNGFELARKLRDLNYSTHIVFTTDSEEYVYEGYNVFALNYIIKPVTYLKCRDVLNIVRTRMENKKYYLCKTTDETVRIPYEEIICVVMNSHNAIITTTTETYITRKTIAEVLTALNDDIFMQCHKSSIVNIQHIFSISRKKLKLTNDIYVNVSDRYINDLNDKFIKYNRNRK